MLDEAVTRFSYSSTSSFFSPFRFFFFFSLRLPLIFRSIYFQASHEFEGGTFDRLRLRGFDGTYLLKQICMYLQYCLLFHLLLFYIIKNSLIHITFFFFLRKKKCNVWFQSHQRFQYQSPLVISIHILVKQVADYMLYPPTPPEQPIYCSVNYFIHIQIHIHETKPDKAETYVYQNCSQH